MTAVAERTRPSIVGGFPLNSGRARSTSMARLRALAEGFERYVAGVARVDREASARQLSELGLRWLDPREVVPLSAEQYASMTWLQPFDERDVLQWVEGRRAASGESVLVPADLVFYPLHATRWGTASC